MPKERDRRRDAATRFSLSSVLLTTLNPQPNRLLFFVSGIQCRRHFRQIRQGMLIE